MSSPSQDHSASPGSLILEMHPVHPDERYMHGGIYRLAAPGHWLIPGGIVELAAMAGLAILARALDETGLGHAFLALAAVLMAACGLVALRQHRLGLAAPPAPDDDTETLLPAPLTLLQTLFILLCVAAMTTLLMLTAPGRLATVVPLAALAILALSAVLAVALASVLYGLRWRRARASYARRHAEPDLGFFGIWDRI